MEDDRDWGPKPFRFLNAWASHPNFLRVVKEAWSRYAVQGWAGYKVSLKLKEVKASLKQWNKEEFGNLNDKLSLIEEQLHSLDLLQERNTLSNNDLQIKRTLKSEYWKTLRLIEITWLQKSRQIWFKEGDKNSKFFHMVASSRQRKNSFVSLNLNGSTVEDPEQIRMGVKMHFHNFFSERWPSRPKFLGSFERKLSIDDARRLELPFSEAKIWEAVRECDGNKAPRPDGFNMKFIKKSWPIIKEDICLFIKEFHLNSKLSKGDH
ncbi:uncharacterized protein LOC114294740 [Camellia sinensis]|uniref:uncharacterized protein LOC114294740 n=1 Tax=Camellia sinensis TaxID=4442 RepID=UPI001035678B|nr:uncharacterized protein LOC114294740 [Camellia sinensis]